MAVENFTSPDKVNVDDEAIKFVNNSYGDYKDMLAFVTEYIAFDMRNIVKRARRNYFGVFQDPYDTVTYEEKYWVPITETIVETGVKTADLDSKNFQIHTQNEMLMGYSRVYQHLFNDKLRRMNWGALLNDTIRNAFIDGTQILKKMKTYDRERKKWVNSVELVDRLNFYCDPGVTWLDDSPVKIERSLMPLDEFRRYRNVWEKTGPAYVKGTQDLPENSGDDDMAGDNRRSTPYVAVWDIWGKIPKSMVTGNASDQYEIVDGHIVISGLLAGEGERVVHLIERNSDGWDPYGAIRPRRVPRRFDGRGPAEQLFGGQEYLNMTVNIRKNNALVLQNGLFKAKIGKGITSDVVSQAVAGGVIPVYDMDDFQQVPVNDVRQSSYTDERSIVDWSQRVSFASDAIQGAESAASKAATVATIQDRNSRSAFDLMDEDMGLEFERFFNRHILPDLASEYSPEEILRITGKPSDFETIDKAWVNETVNKQLLKYIEEKVSVPPSSWVEDQKIKARNKLRRMGKSRHVKITKELLDKTYGVELVITNDRIDRQLIIQQMKELMNNIQGNPQSKYDSDKVLEKTLSLMGLDASGLEKDEVSPPPEELPETPGVGSAAPQKNAARVTPARSSNPIQGYSAGQTAANAARRFEEQSQ